jgi:4-hydroxy-tetrahydrodipicolinate reductase
MNIALIGHGKMGKEVESLAEERRIKILRVFSSGNNPSGAGLTKESLKGVDVCIDFSTPAAVVENITAVVEAGKNMVVGTTGWQQQTEQVKSIVKKHKVGFLHSSNFSLGVNLLMQMVLDAAHLVDRYSEYDVTIHEVHHRGKADSPSGTALSLGSIVLQSMKRKSSILHETPRAALKPEQLHVTSSRVGHVVGKHTVLFDSEFDSIELVHTAKSRRGFALGALVAAEWLNGKKGFYTMKDVILP